MTTKAVTPEDLFKMNDVQLKRKQTQIKNIFLSPHRHGVNYLRILEIRKEIADALHQNSFDRVMHPKPDAAILEYWKRDIGVLIAEKLEIGFDEAIDIIEAQDFYIMQSWAKDLSVEETANLIIEKSKI